MGVVMVPAGCPRKERERRYDAQTKLRPGSLARRSLEVRRGKRTKRREGGHLNYLQGSGAKGRGGQPCQFCSILVGSRGHHKPTPRRPLKLLGQKEVPNRDNVRESGGAGRGVPKMQSWERLKEGVSGSQLFLTIPKNYSTELVRRKVKGGCPGGEQTEQKRGRT